MPDIQERQEIPLEQCREELQEEDAVLVPNFDSARSTLTGDAEINRGWDELSPDHIPALESYLEVYASAKNTVPSRTVTDPIAEHQVWPGVWRQVYVRRLSQAGGVSMLVQTLRRGYITILASGTTIDWTEARLRNSRGVANASGTTPTVEEYALVEWRNISPYSLESIKDSLTAISTCDPIIRGAAYGTGWYILNVSSVIEQDGSGTIVALLASPRFSIESYQRYGTTQAQKMYYLYNVPKYLAQDVVDSYRDTGRSATIQYNNETGTCDIVVYEQGTTETLLLDQVNQRSCAAVMTIDYYWSVADPNTYPLPATAEVGYSYTRQVQANPDGTYDVIIATRETQYRDYDWWQVYTETYRTTMEKVQIGASADDVDTDDFETAEQGVTKTRSIQINDDCTRDVATREQTDDAMYVPAGAATDDTAWLTWETRYGTASLYIGRNLRALPTARIAALANAVTTEETDENGNVSNITRYTDNSVDVQLNPNGTWDCVIRKSPYRDNSQYWSSYSWYEYGIEKRNDNTSRITVDAAGQGREVSNSYVWKLTRKAYDIQYAATDYLARQYGNDTLGYTVSQVAKNIYAVIRLLMVEEEKDLAVSTAASEGWRKEPANVDYSKLANLVPAPSWPSDDGDYPWLAH